MWEYEIRSPETAYPVLDFFHDLRDSLFAELRRFPIQIDPFRRHLQRHFVEKLQAFWNPPAASPSSTRRFHSAARSPDLSTSDIPAYAHLVLQELYQQLQRLRIRRIRDDATRAHLLALRQRLKELLEIRSGQ